jgi:glutamate carboxypeptidase
MDDRKKQAFDFIDRHRQDMLALWADLVTHESPSADKPAVDALALKVRDILATDGGDARIVAFPDAGNMVVATIGGDRAGRPVGLLGHYDTVFPGGTTAERPFCIRDGRAYGPGVLDMKGGVVILLYALKALRAAGYADRPIRVVLAGDEEVAHQASDAAAVFQRELAGCVAAFNCETGFVDDRLVVGRKGGGTYTMQVQGVAAHVGNAPEKGRSAILEIAHKIVDIHALTDLAAGTTFSVGTITGGSTSNTCPAEARIEIDVRCTTAAAEARFVAQLLEVSEKTYIEGTHTTLSGKMGFSPMETTPEVMRLFEFVAATSRAHGLPQPKAVRSGGGSDSSNAVVAGVPTVCAMGVKGEGNHAPTEYALVDSLFERCKLLAACILDIGTFEAQGGQA